MLRRQCFRFMLLLAPTSRNCPGMSCIHFSFRIPLTSLATSPKKERERVAALACNCRGGRLAVGSNGSRCEQKGQEKYHIDGGMSSWQHVSNLIRVPRSRMGLLFPL